MWRRCRVMACAVLMALVLAGCTPFASQNINDLLRAPALGEGLDEIQKALAAYLGDEQPQYKFPKEGDWRSPLLRADLDGDGAEEAILLYTVPESGALSREKGTAVYVAVLELQEDAWVVVQDIQGLSTEVASVEVADLLGTDSRQLLVGYATANLNSRTLALYTYQGERLVQQQMYEYSRYEIADFTGRGGSDLVVVSREEQSGGMQLRYVATENGRFLSPPLPAVTLERNFNSCALISPSAGHGGERLIIIDGITGEQTSGPMASQILYYPDVNGNFYMVEDSGAMLAATGRKNHLLKSRDVDGDGIVEIPLRTGSTEIVTPAGDKNLEWVMWTDFTREEPQPKWFGLMDTDHEVFIRLPDTWRDEVMVVDGNAKGEWKVQRRSSYTTLMSLRVLKSGDQLPLGSLRVPGTASIYLVLAGSLADEERDTIQMFTMR